MKELEFNPGLRFSDVKCPYIQGKMVGSVGCEDCEHFDHISMDNKVACYADENLPPQATEGE